MPRHNTYTGKEKRRAYVRYHLAMNSQAAAKSRFAYAFALTMMIAFIMVGCLWLFCAA